MKSEPVVKLPQVSLDGMTDPTTSAAVRSLLIGSRVAVTGLPTPAPLRGGPPGSGVLRVDRDGRVAPHRDTTPWLVSHR